MAGGDLNILQVIWESGFVVKMVLLSLIIASVLSWAIILKKIKISNALKEANQDFFKVYKNAHSLKEVMEKCESLSFSPYQRMIVHGYSELSKLKEGFEDDRELLVTHFREFGLGVLERGLKRGVHEVDVELEKFLSTLASIASVSPFVGLFGTVWGIINSFTGIAGGGATLDAVAPGIAEALVATAVGLLAAIPAVWFFNKFNNDNGHFHGEMESFGQDFLNIVERTVVQSR